MTDEARTGPAPKFPEPPEKKKAGCAPFLIWGSVCLVVLVGIGAMFGDSDEDATTSPVATDVALSDQAATDTGPAAATADAIEPPPPPSPWRYSQSRDPMTDQATNIACTTSSNQVQQEWPYRPTTANLCIRQSPQHGLDVYMALNGDGQIICRRYNDCIVRVRFGDGQQQSFSAGDAADGSTNIIFFINASRFVNAVKSADTTRIQFTLYRAGSPVLEFPTANLEWPRP